MKTHLSDHELVKLFRSFYLLGDSTILKILYDLDRYGEKNFTELKDGLGINPASLSKKLRKLQDFGIIDSDTTHDRLRVYYSITNHHKLIKRFLDSFERLSDSI